MMRFKDIEISIIVRERSQALGNNTSDCEVVFRLSAEPPLGWVEEFGKIADRGGYLLAKGALIQGRDVICTCTPKVLPELLRHLNQVVFAANDSFKEKNRHVLSTQKELDRVLDELEKARWD
jgi:hypothetical protein